MAVQVLRHCLFRDNSFEGSSLKPRRVLSKISSGKSLIRGFGWWHCLMGFDYKCGIFSTIITLLINAIGILGKGKTKQKIISKAMYNCTRNKKICNVFVLLHLPVVFYKVFYSVIRRFGARNLSLFVLWMCQELNPYLPYRSL